MMSVEQIREMSRTAAAAAARANKQPLVWEEGDHPMMLRALPFVGDYVPEGWTTTERSSMVDNTGLGADDEPALTFGQFAQWVRPGYGYAITECGQFQVVVQEYLHS